MLRFTKLAHRPRTLYRMTGLTPEQFSLLSNRLKPVWKEAERERLSRPDRKRAIGAGRLYALSTLEDKLLALLMFYRFYLTDELMGWICGLDKSNVCRLRGKLQPLLEKAADPFLGIPLKRRIPPGAKKISTWEELLKVCPDFADVVTDATEQPRQRPTRHTNGDGTRARRSGTRSRPRSRPMPRGRCFKSAAATRAGSTTTGSFSRKGPPGLCLRPASILPTWAITDLKGITRIAR